MLLQMSEFEREVYEQQQQARRNAAPKRKSMRQIIEEYPGRVVSVERAYDRMRSRPGRPQGMNLHYACTTPLKFSESA